LAALPVVKLHQRVKPELPVADMVVLPLLELLKAVPLSPGADGLVLKGADGWETYLPLDFVRTYHPYLLLYYDGRPPSGGWPKIYGKKPLAPYFSDISPALGPPLESELEYGYNDANQIVEIQAAVTRDRYAPFFSKKLAGLSAAASEGRKVFLANCNNCHQGPGEVGGNVSHRPFSLLSALAASNPDYFINFVRKPTSYDPTTVMPAYGDMSKVDLQRLMAFLTEARAAGVE
jgi:mono/diheme cytochrome c family protein